MKILSLHTLGHDTCISLFHDGKLLYTIETERISRLRHDRRVEIAIDHIKYLFNLSDVNILVFSSDVKNSIAKIENFDKIIHNVSAKYLHVESYSMLLGYRLPCVIVAHEACHAMVAYHYSNNINNCLTFVNEGRGTFSRNSLFLCNPGSIKLLEYDSLPWYGTGFGWSALSHFAGFGPSPSAAGKAMALAGFGAFSNKIYEFLKSFDDRLHYKSRHEQLIEYKKLKELLLKKEITIEDVCITFQNMFTDTVLKYVSEKSSYNNSALALSGGCALNINTNTTIRDVFGSNLHIPPICNDSGQSIGAGIYVSEIMLQQKVEPISVFSGGVDILDDVKKINGFFKTTEFDAHYIAEQIANGCIVGFCQGKSEIGPRALGNRSILASAQINGMKKKVSQKIKNREWFRPLGGIMTLGSFNNLFNNQIPSPYMLYNYKMPLGLAPEVTHVDGSSRIQTLTENNNPRLFSLLSSYKDLTGESILINTSLNTKGKAMAASVENVIDDFLVSDIDLFVFGNIIAKRK